jgi:alanine racemase
VRAFKDGGFQPLFHASGSAGTLLFPEAHFDMVRVGILQYGLWPSTEMKHFLDGKIKLIPVLTWRTIASEVKNIPKGSLIGYGFTERVSKSATIAICPIGYWHGYSRALSSMGYALVHGKRAKVLGRVSMDMIAIDITGIRAVREGSVVTLIGKDQKVTISADELAKLSDTINYEIVTRLNPLIKRIWI